MKLNGQMLARAGLLALGLWLAGCEPQGPTPVDVKARGELRVATLYGPTSYYLGAEGPEGLDYRLLQDYTQSLGVKLAITVYPNVAALRAALRENRADLAAAQLSHDPAWGRDGLPAKPYYEMPQIWVGRRGGPLPRSLAALAERSVLVRADSPQHRRALEVQRAVPGLKVLTLGAGTASNLYDLILTGTADLALVDADELAFARLARPKLATAFADTLPRPVQWIAAPAAAAMVRSIDDFFAMEKQSGLLAKAMQSAIPKSRRRPRVATREFELMQATRLPPLLPYFEEAAQQSGLDWRLLAALAYQESQWDPTAVSPNGAQGVLMLMPATARSLNVTDSFDARTNILGGARYLAEQRRRLPARITEPDRTYFALAMYNIGLGHVESARVITQKNGANPDRWQDVRNFLPLLEESYWNSQVASGYARGSEAADLVEKVRQYYQLLANYTPVIDESLLEDFGDAVPAATEATPANTDSATEEPNKENAAPPTVAPTAPETPAS